MSDTPRTDREVYRITPENLKANVGFEVVNPSLCRVLERELAAAKAGGARVVDIPEGWKLVPIEPTAGMIEAVSKRPPGFSPTASLLIYRGMVAVAPQPEGVSNVGDPPTACRGSGWVATGLKHSRDPKWEPCKGCPTCKPDEQPVADEHALRGARLLFNCLTFLDEDLRRSTIPTELSQRRNALVDRLRAWAADRPLQHGAPDVTPKERRS